MELITERVRRGGRDIHLSPSEFKILRHLLQHPEQVSTREELKNAAWQGNVHVGRRTIDVQVGRLRKALLSASDRDLIRTARSVGYALSNQPGDGGQQGGNGQHGRAVGATTQDAGRRTGRQSVAEGKRGYVRVG